MDQRNLGLVGLTGGDRAAAQGERELVGGAHRGGIPVPLSPSVAGGGMACRREGEREAV